MYRHCLGQSARLGKNGGGSECSGVKPTNLIVWYREHVPLNPNQRNTRCPVSRSGCPSPHPHPDPTPSTCLVSYEGQDCEARKQSASKASDLWHQLLEILQRVIWTNCTTESLNRFFWASGHLLSPVHGAARRNQEAETTGI